MTKAKLTAAEVKALESVLHAKGSKEEIVQLHISHNRNWFAQWQPLSNLELDDLIRALYIGYEQISAPIRKRVSINWVDPVHVLDERYQSWLDVTGKIGSPPNIELFVRKELERVATDLRIPLTQIKAIIDNLNIFESNAKKELTERD